MLSRSLSLSLKMYIRTFIPMLIHQTRSMICDTLCRPHSEAADSRLWGPGRAAEGEPQPRLPTPCQAPPHALP